MFNACIDDLLSLPDMAGRVRAALRDPAQADSVRAAFGRLLAGIQVVEGPVRVIAEAAIGGIQTDQATAVPGPGVDQVALPSVFPQAGHRRVHAIVHGPDDLPGAGYPECHA